MKIKDGRGALTQQNSHKFPRQGGKDSWLIYARLNKNNLLDFSCGLKHISGKKAAVFTLVRYNGKSHHHTNHLDNDLAFYDFHIHRATEKYQNSRYKGEHYATPTDRYSRLEDALICLVTDLKIKECLQ